MQTATAALAAALTSRERTPVVRAKADWGRDGTYAFDPGVFSDVFSDTFEGAGDIGDLSGFVESVTVDRSLTTELPDAARLDTGYSAAQATVSLAGDLSSGIGLPQALTPHGSAGETMRRINTPVYVELGAVGDNGPEYLRQFTGKVRSVGAEPESASVSLSALDGRERLRTPVSLPTLVSDDLETVRAGLNAQWVMDRIARANGIYVAPPLRAQAFLSATLHGSAWPELGVLTSAKAAGSSLGPPLGPAVFDAHASGLLGLTCPPTSTGQSFLEYAVAAGLNTNTGSTLYVEAILTTNLSYVVINVMDPTAAWNVRFTIGSQGGGGVDVVVTRNSVASASVNVPLAPLGTAGDHLAGVQVTFTATGFVVQARCEATTGTVTGTVANPSGSANLTKVVVAPASAPPPWCIVSSLQVTSEPYTAGMFNNAFVPTAAFEESFNELTATPTVDTSDPWEVLQQIAAAEQGIILFDENNILRFYNRNHMSGGAPVTIITTDPATFANLKAITSSESVDSVRNYISVGASPFHLDPAGTAIWSLSELIGIPANSSLWVPVEFPGPVYSVSGYDYRAAVNADGTGGDVANVTVTEIVANPRVWTLVLSNPNAFDVFMVGNSTVAVDLQGQPYFNVVGRCVRSTDSGYVAVQQNTRSQGDYGYQPLDVPANAWRQSSASAGSLAVYLASVLADPHPTLSGVEIVGDPRLQLTDRVRVVEPDGLTLDGEFWVVGLQTTLSSGGLTQSVTLRQT